MSILEDVMRAPHILPFIPPSSSTDDDVNVSKAFRDFITTWRASDLEVDEDMMHLSSKRRQEVDTAVPLYLEKLYEIDQTEISILNTNLGHVKNFSEPLYRKIIAYPAEVIPYLDKTINEIFFEKIKRHLSIPIEVRPFNADKTRNMRSLNPGDIDQLITITGMVTLASTPIPEMRQGFFRCLRCRHRVERQMNSTIPRIPPCPNCREESCFRLVLKGTRHPITHFILMKECDDLPSGQTPLTITVTGDADLLKNVLVGSTNTFTGIIRSQNQSHLSIEGLHQVEIMADRGGGSKGGKGEKKLTFKEKSSIKFVEQDEPDFIKAMKKNAGFREAATVEDKFLVEDDDDFPDTVEGELLRTKEEERPQVVILNAETDLGDDELRKALDAQQKKEDEKKIEEGRITFKKPKKRGVDGKEVVEDPVEEKKKKIEKMKQPEKKIERNLPSFGDDEEEE